MVKVLRSLVRGPLEPYAAGFVDELFRQGYTPASAEQQLCLIAHLDRWMVAEKVTLGGLSGPALERYLAQRRSKGYAEHRSVKALKPLLGYLTPLGVLPPAEAVVLGPVDALLARYREYLLSERGLTPGTVRGYLHVVRPFVTGRVRGDAVDLAGLTAADVTGFVLAACPGRATGSAKLIVCGLRSLLGWLHLMGDLPGSLTGAVPSVVGRRLAGLPKALDTEQLRLLLAGCDQRTPTGRRDYAIMLLLARMGLRAGEVAGLGLDDIDWRHGEISVRGKGNRLYCAHLPDWPSKLLRRFECRKPVGPQLEAWTRTPTTTTSCLAGWIGRGPRHLSVRRGSGRDRVVPPRPRRPRGPTHCP